MEYTNRPNGRRYFKFWDTFSDWGTKIKVSNCCFGRVNPAMSTFLFLCLADEFNACDGVSVGCQFLK